VVLHIDASADVEMARDLRERPDHRSGEHSQRGDEGKDLHQVAHLDDDAADGHGDSGGEDDLDDHEQRNPHGGQSGRTTEDDHLGRLIEANSSFERKGVLDVEFIALVMASTQRGGIGFSTTKAIS